MLLQPLADAGFVSVTTFGVVADDVRAEYFPHWSAFSATTKPTSTVVATFITEEGADLGGRLRLESITPSTVTSGSTPEAYAWCQKTLRLMVAIRVARASTAQNPDVVKAWKTELDERLEQLNRHGTVVLGDAVASDSTSPPEGPTTHITQYGLDVGDPNRDSSSVEPRLRRSDEL